MRRKSREQLLREKFQFSTKLASEKFLADVRRESETRRAGGCVLCLLSSPFSGLTNDNCQSAAGRGAFFLDRGALFAHITWKHSYNPITHDVDVEVGETSKSASTKDFTLSANQR